MGERDRQYSSQTNASELQNVIPTAKTKVCSARRAHAEHVHIDFIVVVSNMWSQKPSAFLQKYLVQN